MMSGALFLPREIEIKKLYSKNISRMAISYVVWSVFYALLDAVRRLFFEDGYQISFHTIINDCISGEVHLWFLPMIIGLYMCLPLLKNLTKNDTSIKYFLLLSFIFCFVKTETELVITHFLNGEAASFFESFNTVFKNFHMDIVLGFVPYFILGYYLNKTEISKNNRIIIYILGFIGFVATVVLNTSASKNAGQSLSAFYEPKSLNVLLMATAVFVWFKYNAKGNEKFNKIIIKLSKYSFGAFLAHIAVIKVLTALGLEPISFHSALSVPTITLITAIASYFISFVLNKIPVIKKYIV